MKVINDYPPNYSRIAEAFDLAGRSVVFTYGDVLYNPHRGNIKAHLLRHEEVHSRQQAAYPGGPAAWWERYLADPDFRFRQEVEAYAAQYSYYCDLKSNRWKQLEFLDSIAGDLSSKIYGSICSPEKARSAILFAAE